MKAVVLVTVLNILAIASCLPTPVQKDEDSCIVMTPSRKTQFNYIEEQISKLIIMLEDNIGDILIKDVFITVGKYTEESAKKNINFAISVDECADDDDNKQLTEDVASYEDVKSIEEPTIIEEPMDIEEPSDIERPTRIDVPTVLEEPTVVESPKTSEKPKVIEEPIVIEDSTVVEEIKNSEEQEYSEETVAESNNSGKEQMSCDEFTSANEFESSKEVTNEVNYDEYTNEEDEEQYSYTDSNFDSSSQITKVEENNNTADQTSDTEASVEVKETKDPVTSKPTSIPEMEVICLKLDDSEERIVREMEKKRGIKPFLLIEHNDGKRNIKFF